MTDKDKMEHTQHTGCGGGNCGHNHDHENAESDAGTSRRDFFKSAAVGAVAATSACQILSNQAMAHGDRDRVFDLLDRSKRDRKRRILIKGGIVLSMDPAVGDFMKADVLIEGKHIKAVGPNIKASNAITVDASNTIVMPGFVNTHHHQFQTNTRNYFADAYYFQSQLYPDYRRAGAPGGIHEKYTPEDCYLGEYMGSVTNISHGVTTVCDTSQVSSTPQHSDACVQGLMDSGLRAVYAYTQGPGNSVTGPNYAFPQDIRRIKQRYFNSDDQLVTLAFGGFNWPVIFPLARELDLPIFAHVSGPVTGPQVEGLGIGPDCTFIHCMSLPDSTWRKMADNGAKVSICAVSEPTVANGTPPFMEVAKYGMASRTSFSTDTESFITADFFSQMRGAFTVQRFLTLQQSNNGQLASPVPITCREVIEMATMGGATGANVDHKVGSLTPGKEADIIMLRTDMINVSPITNVPGAIVTLMDTSNVDTVFIAGNVKKWKGKLVDVDVPKLLRRMEKSRDELFARTGWVIEPFGTCCPR